MTSQSNHPYGLARYERKFLVEGQPLSKILTCIRRHPARFRSIYTPRQINNVYFDTPDLAYYWESVEGDASRLKPRVRWYGSSASRVVNPCLEIKRKQGSLGYKQVLPLNTPSLELNEWLDQWPSANHMSEGALADWLPRMRQLRPTLMNYYQRRYWLSLDGQFRLTLDQGLGYVDPAQTRLSASVGQMGRHIQDDQSLVVELKYAPEADAIARDITQHFPFRMVRSSKYTMGLDSLFGVCPETQARTKPLCALRG